MYRLFAIFKRLSTGETIVYIRNSNSERWRFQGKKVSMASLEMATDIRDKIACVWYSYQNAGSIHSISNHFPESLINLIKEDNTAFGEEVKLMS
jgi:hypothetical protein